MDITRALIDIKGERGLYVLTGSASPYSYTTIQNGTGRIVSVDMLPMALFDSRDSTAEVSLRYLFDEPEDKTVEIEGVRRSPMKGGSFCAALLR